MQNLRTEMMTMILTIGAAATACLFLFSALLLVCRGFAMQGAANTPEPYEVRLWVKYSNSLASETRRAA